jgi:hypothetical protein
VLSKQVTARCVLFTLTVVVGTTLGCGNAISREELAGTYRLPYDYGTEQLTVHSDGTYTQEFAEPAKESRVINSGRWELSQGDFWDGQLINLHDPVIVDVLGKRSDFERKPGRWPMRVRKTWGGQPRFLVNEDLGYVFERVKQ